jgi:hypothetical protein
VSGIVAFDAEQNGLMDVLDLIEQAYDLTTWEPIRNQLFLAKREAEQRLADSLLRAVRPA